jgi:hypothetical protein
MDSFDRRVVKPVYRPKSAPDHCAVNIADGDVSKVRKRFEVGVDVPENAEIAA